MKPHQIKAFLCVAQLHSIRRAAEALHITQPAVSRAVRELEAGLEVPLFERGPQGVTLTAYGEAFQHRARLLVEEEHRARDELRQMRDGQLGRVRVAVSSVPAVALLPQALAIFRAQLPMIALELSDGLAPTALPALQEGLLDLALVQHQVDRIGADLDAEVLFTTPLAVCARVGHPRGRARSLAALEGEEWVGWDRAMIEHLFTRNGRTVPQRIVISRSMEITRALVGRGDLVSVFARPLIEREMVRHGIRAIPVRDPLPEITVSLVTRRGSLPTPAAARFIAALHLAARTPGERLR